MKFEEERGEIRRAPAGDRQEIQQNSVKISAKKNRLGSLRRAREQQAGVAAAAGAAGWGAGGLHGSVVDQGLAAPLLGSQDPEARLHVCIRVGGLLVPWSAFWQAVKKAF